MSIRWRDEALEDLDAIYLYIAVEKQNPVSAERVINTIYEHTVETLGPHPMRGRKGRVPGTRELVNTRYPNYISVYELIDGEVEIISVRNTSRDWPDSFEDGS